MSTQVAESREMYKVVVNDEEQYCLWPALRANSPGWHDTGKTGSREECLTYIREVWTDMRPLSLRKGRQSSQAAATK